LLVLLVLYYYDALGVVSRVDMTNHVQYYRRYIRTGFNTSVTRHNRPCWNVETYLFRGRDRRRVLTHVMCYAHVRRHQSSRLSGVRLWALITLRTLRWETGRLMANSHLRRRRDPTQLNSAQLLSQASKQRVVSGLQCTAAW